MAKKANHIIQSSSGWVVKKSGSVKASKLFDTKDKAVEYGIELSKKEKTELYIHRKNGMVLERNSFVGNPKPSKVA